MPPQSPDAKTEGRRDAQNQRSRLWHLLEDTFSAGYRGIQPSALRRGPDRGSLIPVHQRRNLGRIDAAAKRYAENTRVAAAVDPAVAHYKESGIMIVQREIPHGKLHCGSLIRITRQILRAEILVDECDPAAIREGRGQVGSGRYRVSL